MKVSFSLSHNFSLRVIKAEAECLSVLRKIKK